MTERFIITNGTVAITTDTSTVTGTGTTFSGLDLAGAPLRAVPTALQATALGLPNALPFLVGHVAEVDPRGQYDNLELPLVSPYRGPTLTAMAYELGPLPALASRATPSEVFQRYAAHLDQNMGLVGNSDDDIDLTLVPNNSIIINSETLFIEQWRNGVLTAVKIAVGALNIKGTWAAPTLYDAADIVTHNGTAYFAVADNTNSTPLPDNSNPNWSVFLSKGDTGSTGLQGLQGIQGLQGLTGAAGADGKTVRYGVGAPANLLGNDGDFYIALDTTFLYGPKVTGTWPAGVSLIGPQGNPGGQGDGLDYDASGTIDERDDYDNEPQGFSFLQTDVSPFLLWIKASNTTADWAGPTPIGSAAPLGSMGSVADAVLSSFSCGAIA